MRFLYLFCPWLHFYFYVHSRFQISYYTLDFLINQPLFSWSSPSFEMNTYKNFYVLNQKYLVLGFLSNPVNYCMNVILTPFEQILGKKINLKDSLKFLRNYTKVREGDNSRLQMYKEFNYYFLNNCTFIFYPDFFKVRYFSNWNCMYSTKSYLCYFHPLISPLTS